MRDKKALLIIDMQKGSFTPKTPRYNTNGVVKRINELAEFCRKMEFPVVFIQHDGSKENEFIPKTTEWELLSELKVEKGDIFINKYANDVFYKSELQLKLSDLEVNELFITGCATDFCVEATVQSALAKDYHITIVKDGHTTGDRPHLKAEKIIEHYNWVWGNLTPTNGSVEVINFDGIKKLLPTQV